MKKEFELTQGDLDGVIAAIQRARNTPLIALQCGMPESPQEAANSAWKALGKEKGFDGMSVEPSKKGDLFVLAYPN